MIRHNPPLEQETGFRNVIVELKGTAALQDLAFAAMENPQMGLETAAVPEIPGISWDPTFPPVQIPRAESPQMAALGIPAELTEEPTYIVRGVMREEAGVTPEMAVAFHPATVQIFADPRIEPFPICPGSPPLGTAADVERLLCVPNLQSQQMDGQDVLVAIVDTGFNLGYLSSVGKVPAFDAGRSWTFSPSVPPGAAPVNHGTMCAFDVCIAAPNCTLIDVVLLRAGITFHALLSDAVLAYNHLLRLLRSPGFFESFRGLVVNNSWGMFHPSWDFPVGHPANYSDNPSHPFNVIVSVLERNGADIVFAAGNCGFNCPDFRCGGVTTSSIYGANSHPQVLSVGGVGIDQVRVGYSSTGPGRLQPTKPDLCGYTHFSGSGVYVADGGTSAAAPVVAGVAAAVRTQRRYVPGDPATSPAALRAYLINHADPRLPSHGNEYGWGIVSGCHLP